jgi:hypothetical protein
MPHVSRCLTRLSSAAPTLDHHSSDLLVRDSKRDDALRSAIFIARGPPVPDKVLGEEAIDRRRGTHGIEKHKTLIDEGLKITKFIAVL